MSKKTKMTEKKVSKEVNLSFEMCITGADFSSQEKAFLKVVEQYKSKKSIVYPSVIEIFRLAKKYLKKR